jgi:hypothetical protein
MGQGLGSCGRGLRRGLSRRLNYRRYFETDDMTREEIKKILETKLKNIDKEKMEIEKRLNEIKSGIKCQDHEDAEE